MSRIIARNGTYYVRADAVKLDDALDLEGDRYADPETFADPDHEPMPDMSAFGFRFETAQVVDIVKESPGVLVIETTLGTFGFPPDHEIEISLERTPDE